MRRLLVSALLLTACEPLILIVPPEVEKRDGGRPISRACGDLDFSTTQTSTTVSALFPYDGATYAVYRHAPRWVRIDPESDERPVPPPDGLEGIVEVYDADLITAQHVWLSAKDDEGGVALLVDLDANVVTKRIPLGMVTLGSIAGTPDGSHVFGTGRRESGGGAWEIRNDRLLRIAVTDTSTTHNVTPGAAVYVEGDGAYLVPTNNRVPGCIVHVTPGARDCFWVAGGVVGSPYTLSVIDGAVYVGTSHGYVVPLAATNEFVMTGLTNQAFGGFTCDDQIDRWETVQAFAPTAIGGFMALNCHFAVEQTPTTCPKVETAEPFLTHVERIAVEAPDTYLVAGTGGVRRIRIRRE